MGSDLRPGAPKIAKTEKNARAMTSLYYRDAIKKYKRNMKHVNQQRRLTSAPWRVRFYFKMGFFHEMLGEIVKAKKAYNLALEECTVVKDPERVEQSKVMAALTMWRALFIQIRNRDYGKLIHFFQTKFLKPFRDRVGDQPFRHWNFVAQQTFELASQLERANHITAAQYFNRLGTTFLISQRQSAQQANLYRPDTGDVEEAEAESSIEVRGEPDFVGGPPRLVDMNLEKANPGSGAVAHPFRFLEEQVNNSKEIFTRLLVSRMEQKQLMGRDTHKALEDPSFVPMSRRRVIGSLNCKLATEYLQSEQYRLAADLFGSIQRLYALDGNHYLNR